MDLLSRFVLSDLVSLSYVYVVWCMAQVPVFAEFTRIRNHVIVVTADNFFCRTACFTGRAILDLPLAL